MRTIRPKLGVFSEMFEIQLFCCFITHLVKKLQQLSLYEVIEDILLFVLDSKQPLSDNWVFIEKFEILNFSKNTQNCFAYISATKYRSEAVLYSKQSTGYPLSPHIKTISVAYLPAE